MLIKCPKCNAPFDIEKRGSVCPQCGTDTAKIKHKKVKTEQEKRAFRDQLILSLIMIALMIGAFVASQVYIASAKNKKAEQLGVLETQMVAMQSYINIWGDKVAIWDCEIVEGLEGHLPEGYSFLAVSYVTKLEMSSGLAYDIDTYLMLPTGEYVKPLDKASVEEVLNAAGVSMVGLTDYIDAGNGKLVFLVSDETKNAAVAIYNKMKIRNKKQLEEAGEDMTCIYHIPLEWEVTQ